MQFFWMSFSKDVGELSHCMCVFFQSRRYSLCQMAE